MYPSIFDTFFSPVRIVVVTPEQLREAELKEKKRKLTELNNAIDSLTSQRDALANEIEDSLAPQVTAKKNKPQQERDLVSKSLSLDSDVEEVW